MPGTRPISLAIEDVIAAPVTIDASRCVASRHRASGCRACVGACGVQALRFEAGRVAVDAFACNGCLACASACPTEAITVAGETVGTLSRRSDEALEAAGGVAVFACRRAMERSDADPSAVVAVPCLARLDESSLCEQAARGAYRVVLVDAGCPGCPRSACDAVVAETVECANSLLSACGADVKVERARAFPQEVSRGAGDGLDVGRRLLLIQAAELARGQMLEAAAGFAGGRPRDARPAGACDPLETIGVDRRMRLLGALDAMGAPEEARITARRFHTVDVSAEKCTGCGVCAMFCPTGALRFGESAPGGALEWSAAECVGCRLCGDVCAFDAVTLTPGVSCGELLDLEPRVLGGEDGGPRPMVPAAAGTVPGTPRGSVASRFFSNGRSADPSSERMHAKVEGLPL